MRVFTFQKQQPSIQNTGNKILLVDKILPKYPQENPNIFQGINFTPNIHGK